ncbi:MAG: hypothetical protein QY325_09060 [Flavobacteriales bacterium]|nr:MAG: hypothetical protein QY325_09060 [Flavobacteriales bacterium]
MNIRTSLPAVLLIALLAGACSSSQPLAQQDDDVYFMPSQAPRIAAAPTPVPSQEPSADKATDDYYDPGTSRDLGASRSYYDMAYNDPYYYNYGRFGFGTGFGMGMGWQSGWNGPGWGMGMGWGSNPYGWSDPWGWNRPMGWNRPWGWNDPWRWNSPWGWNDGWGYGFGGYNGWGWNGYSYYGNYWGPFGACGGCYTPVIVGGSSNTYIGHRPSTTGSSLGTGNGSVRPRASFRDPVGLSPRPVEQPASLVRPAIQQRQPASRPMDRGIARPDERPVQRPVVQPPQRRPSERPTERQPVERRPTINDRGNDRPVFERSAPAPSRTNDGGGAPTRHRSR